MPRAADTPAARRPNDGELRHLMNLTAFGVSDAGLLRLAVITYAGWTANSSVTAREETLVENALNRGILRALNEQKSVAWWDEAYRKISGGATDLEFLDSEFGIFLTETYGHDKVFILDAGDRPVFANTGGARRDAAAFERHRPALAPVLAEARSAGASTLRQRPDLFGDDQRHYRTIGHPLDTAKWTGHILDVDGRAAIVAALTILPNVDMDLLKGQPHLLVSIIFIEDDYVSDLGHGLLLPDLRLSAVAATGADVVSMPLEADDGTYVGVLSWTTQRPGRMLTSIVLPLVALGILGVAAQAHSMLQKLRFTSRHLAQQEKRSRHAARHDALSGLPNRTHFAEHLDHALSVMPCDAAGQRAIVAYIDVDCFKDVNDTLGHSAGDALITQVGQRLQGQMRTGDFIARYGGDEFATLWMSADPGAPTILANRISRAFLNAIDVEGQSLVVTASVGIAVAPDNGTTVEEVMRHADIALYEAKNAGRNRAVIFSEDMAEQVEGRRAIEIDLQATIAANGLDLAYQPIINCRTGAITGAEALVRWNHPERGFVSPGTFIPIAEQAGLMPALGEWVLARAMSDWHAWPHLEVSVNLSPMQFRQSDFAALLDRLVREHGVTPSRFVLEITEGVLMDAGERTLGTLAAIRAMGFRTALDDFGTGYSSLAYLCTFRFDKIKIDRSFVSGLSRSESVRTIVRTVVSLGKGLGMDIVAEGVETESEALTMTGFGCAEMQGFYFARPMPRASLEELLACHTPAPLSARPLATTGAAAAE